MLVLFTFKFVDDPFANIWSNIISGTLFGMMFKFFVFRFNHLNHFKVPNEIFFLYDDQIFVSPYNYSERINDYMIFILGPV